ncbi:DUF1275 family protein [Actinomycetospora straminea]|uniref:DUF1275 domain-containing protein n=1 Tax=Actinomycetospora straminea TaxID=663607 RepID=A0ABP9DZS8_9PSEU|nr:YoaK family protein [Actinomycetospora straminea]MDD7930843.1 YoaK family protein [Actinomycetospora straminea]
MTAPATGATRRAPGRVATAATLLAGVAGVVDLWAVTSLGGPFAGVVTGNLVTAGGAAGRGDLGALWPPALAVLGFAVGVVVWSLAWRRHPASVARPLLAELVVLVALAVAWVLAGAGPPGVVLVLLIAASLAMGAQSATALRLGESTTYLTGTLTGGLATLVAGGSRGRVLALRQLGALVVGAAVAAVLLGVARWSVPLLAVALLVAALGVLGRPPRTRPGADGEPPSG